MLDLIPCPAYLHDLVYPYAQSLHLTTISNHIHEVLLSFIFYTILQVYISPALSRIFIPQFYSKFNPRTRINWDIHFVAFVQSLIICPTTLYVIWNDTNRVGETWEDRFFGYSTASGVVQAMATGYFLWDTMVCTAYFNILGPVDLLHAIVAGGVAVLGFRPFALYYGMDYLLFELSTPFVNIHWACDKINMTGSTLQWYNGIALIISFFSCRLIWGNYLNFNFFKDIWSALQADRQMRLKLAGKILPQNKLPYWVAIIFSLGNLALTSLNIFWFSKMIEAVRKRFRPQTETKANGGASKSSSTKMKVR